MDESTAEQWAVIGAETAQNQSRVAERVLGMLRSLADITDGFATDQLTHCCQTATRAERDGADDEVVVASLCHDIGKAISVPGHPQIAAAILKPYVRPEVHQMILVHQDFQGAHYYHHFGGDPKAREKHRDTLTAEESSSPSSSPTTGIRRRSIPTTTRCPSSTSKSASAPSSPAPSSSSRLLEQAIRPVELGCLLEPRRQVGRWRGHGLLAHRELAIHES